MEEISKICKKCELSKSLDAYWDHPTGKYGKRPRCKDCVREDNAEFLKKRMETEPSYARDRMRRWAMQGDNKRRRNLISRYGITLEQYDALLESQNHKCAICDGVMDEGKRLAVDHCHDTGKIRGILHVRCNTAIALFRDSPEICRKAAAYLEKSLS